MCVKFPATRQFFYTLFSDQYKLQYSEYENTIYAHKNTIFITNKTTHSETSEFEAMLPRRILKSTVPEKRLGINFAAIEVYQIKDMIFIISPTYIFSDISPRK
jgi:hypothetical protein